MSSSENLSGELTELQHRSRERSLTPHHASRAHHDTESVVLAGAGMILVSDARGDIPREHADSRGLGLFCRDTRFLNAYELTVNGAPLVPLSSHEGSGAWNFHVLGNPPLTGTGGGCIAPHTICIRRDRMVGEASIHEIIAITNFGAAPVHLALELAFAADFTDIFVVRGIAEPAEHTGQPTAAGSSIRAGRIPVSPSSTRMGPSRPRLSRSAKSRVISSAHGSRPPGCSS